VTNTRQLLQLLCEEEFPQVAKTTVRACSACEGEFGKIPVPANVEISHGYCTRHYSTLYAGFWPKGRISPVPDLAELTPEQRQDWRYATKPFEQADREYERSQRTVPMQTTSAQAA